MIEYLIQNFNWVSFTLALSFFLIISSLSRIIASYFVMKRAKKKAQIAEAELKRLQGKFRPSNQQVRELFKKELEDADPNK